MGALTSVWIKTLEPGFRPEKTGSAAAKGGISEINRRQAIPHPLNPLNLLNPLNPSRRAAPMAIPSPERKRIQPFYTTRRLQAAPTCAVRRAPFLIGGKADTFPSEPFIYKISQIMHRAMKDVII